MDSVSDAGEENDDGSFFEVFTHTVSDDDNVLTVCYRSEEFDGIISYMFENFNLLNEPDRNRFIEVLEEASEGVTRTVLLDDEETALTILPRHLDMIRKVLDNDRDLVAGKLSIIQSILSGYVTESTFLETLLELQIPDTNTKYTSENYLKPTFKYNDNAASWWLRIREPVYGPGAVQDEKIKYLRNFAKLCAFANEDDDDVTWGEIYNQPTVFVDLTKPADLLMKTFEKILNHHSEIIDDENLMKLNKRKFTQAVNVIYREDLIPDLARTYLKRFADGVEFSKYDQKYSFILTEDEIAELSQLFENFSTNFRKLNEGKNVLQVMIWLMANRSVKQVEELLDFGNLYEWDFWLFYNDDFMDGVVNYYKEKSDLNYESLDFGLRVEDKFPSKNIEDSKAYVIVA